MALSLETLISTVLVGSVSAVGLTAMTELNAEIQQISFNQQIENAADCADRVFLLHGVDPVQGVEEVRTYQNTQLNRELLDCVSPITGVTGEQLLQNPTDIYSVKEL